MPTLEVTFTENEFARILAASGRWGSSVEDVVRECVLQHGSIIKGGFTQNSIAGSIRRDSPQVTGSPDGWTENEWVPRRPIDPELDQFRRRVNDQMERLDKAIAGMPQKDRTMACCEDYQGHAFTGFSADPAGSPTKAFCIRCGQVIKLTEGA